MSDIKTGIKLLQTMYEHDLQPDESIIIALLRKARQQNEVELVESTRKYYNIPLSNDYVNQLKLRMRT